MPYIKKQQSGMTRLLLGYELTARGWQPYSAVQKTRRGCA